MNASRNGIDKSESKVVEPGEMTAPKHHQLTGNQGVEGGECPDADSVREVNGEVAADEESDQKQQQRGTAPPPGTRPRPPDSCSPTRLQACKASALD